MYIEEYIYFPKKNYIFLFVQCSSQKMPEGSFLPSARQKQAPMYVQLGCQIFLGPKYQNG
jgi:hypothetical protein